MALRLGRAFEKWGLNYNFWMNIQKKYEQDIKAAELSTVLSRIEPYNNDIDGELRV